MFFQVIKRPFKSIKNHLHNRDRKKIISMFNNCRLHLCDIGADGGVEPRWKRIEELLYLTFFEPDPRSDIEGIKSKNMTVHRKALWECNDSKTLYLTRKGQCSSLYRPNLEYLKLFPNSQRFEITKTIDYSCTTLDSCFDEENPFDFIKIDTQGSELNILKGAQLSLSKAFGLELEVEVKRLYEGQPLLGDVIEFCRQNKYEFIDFVNLSRWERHGFSGLGEMSFGDALFLKYPEQVYENFHEEKISSQSLMKYILILFVYRRNDLLRRLISLLETGNSKDISEKAIKIERLLSREVDRQLRLNRFFNRILGLFFCRPIRAHLLY